MNKYQMIYIVPDQSMVEPTEKILQEENLNIVVKQGVLQSGVDLVRDYLPQGLEVVIARAGTLRAIQEAKLGIALVELPITAFDLVYAVEKAKAYGTRIAVVSYQFMVLGLETVSNYLGVDLRFFYIQNREEADATIATAFAQGYDVVIGGKVTADAARAHKMPCVFIESSRASILQAAYEAKRTAQTVENEKYKRELFSAVVDYANDGIMTVDTSGVITSMNPKAVQITTFKRAVGYNINSLWPGLALDRVIENNIQQLGQILDINGVQVVCNKVPIIVSGRSVGAVVNFQEITNIQQLEASIRREIYSKGHVARFSFSDIWGSSVLIRRVIDIAKDYARTESNILITGETGTGKEVFAQSIHNHSKRKKGPFVAVNCAALPSQLLESELFGYVKGAFTGANKEGKPGLFEMAHGGSIFLDEISELDYVNQGRLLRVLQERTVVRLGSDKVIPVDVRIIAATNKDLGLEVAEKKFRDDLFYRLNVLKLSLPPLRERVIDIRDYAMKFLERYLPTDRPPMTFRPGALRVLEKFDWPGNIRQLQNTIQRAAVLCKEPFINEATIAHCLDVPDKRPNLQSGLTQEIEAIRQALAKAKGKQTEAAKILGINRSTLWRKMQRLGIS